MARTNVGATATFGSLPSHPRRASTGSFGLVSIREDKRWSRVIIFLIIGYLCASRSFAYLGLPWIKLYIGEIFLAAFLLIGPRSKHGSWIRVLRRAKRLRRFEWLLLLFLCYGAFEAFHGILSGYPMLTAFRDTAFNYYPLFLFLGIWVGLKDKVLLRHATRALAWWNGCYGLAYVLFLSRLSLTMPGTASAGSIVPLFSEPYGSAVALLGLLAFEPELRRVWHLLALNALVMLWVQVRAEWVGFAVGLFVFAWLTKRLRKLFVVGAVVAVLLGAMYATHLSLPSPKGRGGRISVDYIMARALAPINKSKASGLVPTQGPSGFEGTVTWRLVWWAGIWQAVNANVGRKLFGFGYGYPIGSLNPFIGSGTFIQTPHSDFFYALGYSGWVGLILFGLLQFELLRLLWRSFKNTGRPFGLMCWAGLLATAMFEDFLEAPFGAIPFYLVAGLATAAAISGRRSAGDMPEAPHP